MILRFKGIILFIQRLLTREEPFASDVLSCGDHVFIVGIPRSGSTLLFQLLVKYCRVGYVSNLMALAPLFMSTIARLTKGSILGYSDLKDSDYGVVAGINAPNEASKISDFWFDDDSAQRLRSVRYTFWKLWKVFGAPVLFKSMNNSLRIPAVLRACPEARFIWIRRDPANAALSLLKARKTLLGSESEWWSLRPDGYERIQQNFTPEEQVLWQISEIERQIEKHLERSGVNWLEIRYEDLVLNAEQEVDRVARHLNLSKKNVRFNEPKVRTPTMNEQDGHRIELLRSLSGSKAPLR